MHYRMVMYALLGMENMSPIFVCYINNDLDLVCLPAPRQWALCLSLAIQRIDSSMCLETESIFQVRVQVTREGY